MTLRLFAYAGVAFAALLTMSPTLRADDDAAKKKNKKKGPDIEAIFKKLDTNNDGQLSAAEFAKAMHELHKKKEAEGTAPKKPGKSGKRAALLFSKLDTDKSGSLSLDEFRHVIEVMKEAKAKKNK